LQYASGQGDGAEDRVRLTAEDEQFRGHVRRWLEENLTGSFASLRGRGGAQEIQSGIIADRALGLPREGRA
jgi:hypothetical protein